MKLLFAFSIVLALIAITEPAKAAPNDPQAVIGFCVSELHPNYRGVSLEPLSDGGEERPKLVVARFKG